jgi:hypothetical protein
MRHVSLVASLLLLPGALFAQQPRPARCTTPDHRAFDFWVGEWEVSDSSGKVVAASSIKLQAAGCAIMEHWQPIGQPDGVSISWLEPIDHQWHQRWVGGDGWITSFTGGMVGQSMVLNDDQATPQGGGKGRMRYTVLPDGRVRQAVESSSDGGKTWSGGAFFYKRKG